MLVMSDELWIKILQGECEKDLVKPTMPAPKPRDGYALGPPPQLPAQDRPRQNQSDTEHAECEIFH